MKRTAKYETLLLNAGKWQALEEIARLYAKEKDRVLIFLGRAVNFRFLDSKRGLRAHLKGSGSSDLAVHLHDQAVFDAADTMRRYIEMAKKQTHVKAKVFVRFQGEERHYAYWLLRSYGRIGLLLGGNGSVPSFEIAPARRRVVVRFLRRTFRKSLGDRPRVRTARSFMVDNTLYGVLTHRGTQAERDRAYVRIAGTVRGHRIMLPLRGRGRISGSVRIVLRRDRRSVEVHMPYDAKTQKPKAAAVTGLDAGVTEVLTSSDGTKYGTGSGQVLDRLSDETTETGRARNRLHRLAEKADASGNRAKARRIRKMNLGMGKLRVRRARGEAEVKRRIGEAVRQALAHGPATVAVEDLSHMRGRTKSRKLSRIVSRWMRSALKERLDFRAAAGSSPL